MTPQPLSPRLLAKEEIEILDRSCKPRKLVITRHDIEHEVSAMLKRGLTTTSAGGFFFIPYLLQLKAHDLASSLTGAKHHGIHNERLALGIVFESIFGFTSGIRAVDSINRADFGLLAGLPFLPSVSTQYRFLQDVCVQDGLYFQTRLGKQLLSLGQIKPGGAVNIDGHNVKTFSRKEMKLSFLTKEDRYGKAIRTFYTQDQESRKPLMAIAAYSGTTVSQVTRQLAERTRDILGQSFILAADKEWYCGQLIQELHKQCGVSVLTPVKSSTKRRQQFDAVPLDQYEHGLHGNIATLYTTMTSFEGPLRLLLKKRPDGRYFALITPATEMTAKTGMPVYTKRWRIEDFFAENSFLGVERLPSMNLNAIQAMLSLRLLAYHVMDNFRHDLGRPYCSHTPKLIHREFVDGIQGRIQIRSDDLEVIVYGFRHQDAVESILTNIDQKLESANVDPRIPWLGNRRIKFKFH